MPHAGLCCEWARSKAQADRWSEEVTLVIEEMCRTLSFLEWKAGWWTSAGTLQIGIAKDMAGGYAAYAAKQEQVMHQMAIAFAMKWHPIHVRNNIQMDWPVSCVARTLDLRDTNFDCDSTASDGDESSGAGSRDFG